MKYLVRYATVDENGNVEIPSSIEYRIVGYDRYGKEMRIIYLVPVRR